MSIQGLSARSSLKLVRRIAAYERLPSLFTSRRPFACAATTQMSQPLHTCDIDAEPLHRYRKGGYHPIRLGDILKDGRYRILHKLGWGAYSTVWAVRDQREHTYVAVKVSVSERGEKSRESKVLRANQSEQPGSPHLVSMLDQFLIDGPNGTHDCLVLELVGPSVADLLETRFRGERLPGRLAKQIAKQALVGLDYLHAQKIGHGDIHTRNLALTLPPLHSLREEEFFQKLGKPETGSLRSVDGNPLDPGMPEYLVRPTCFTVHKSLLASPIRIVDFGESFLSNEIPDMLHTPLVVRAPEMIFGDEFNYRVDLWSMGCMLFELVVGQPPFDSFMTTPTILVRQMLGMLTNDGLPERWQRTWHAMDSAAPGEESEYTLQGWLEEMYFDGERNEDLTREDILKVGELVQRLLRFEPSARASAYEILQDPWFKDD
ncbi:serine protein kinase [Cucurbitaria berberidis CBS 394.84]|uniref:non-specific serine/threonine protein kinase n=1 Tax=Cucurbitaria berberidis CBS 394.84 TaxID=1168544 RepID=A0A9P4GCJ9_9PLEO|nr:serine protein kinase [Cucurbitaria berberidis CBS 394.84]KAF1842922.1 serine protein kinase [Cucurbitaria berberidis CBS 394.84]